MGYFIYRGNEAIFDNDAEQVEFHSIEEAVEEAKKWVAQAGERYDIRDSNLNGRTVAYVQGDLDDNDMFEYPYAASVTYLEDAPEDSEDDEDFDDAE